MEAKRSKHRIGYFIGVCSKENQIARFDVERLFDASEFLIGEELDDGALFLAVRSERDPGHALRAVLAAMSASFSTSPRLQSPAPSR